MSQTSEITRSVGHHNNAIGRRLAIGRLIVILGVAMALTSCEMIKRPTAKGSRLGPEPVLSTAQTSTAPADERPADQPDFTTQQDTPAEVQLFPGTDRYLNRPGNAQHAAAVGEQGEIVLNFENVPLRDVVRDILGRILSVNYLFDPRVDGTVSLRTTKPLSHDAVMPTLEMILRQNGAALVKTNGIYRVVPSDEAAKGQFNPILGNVADPIRPGYGVLIVPLQYISAVQMGKILEPLLPDEGVLRVDIDRNVIILAGTSGELQSLRDTVEIFDVDWLQGMSAGLFPLANVSAETMAQELDVIFGDPAEGPLAGLLQLVPIERLNALLVVTQRSKYLEEVRTWIERLDKGAESGVSLFVYYVQNGKAEDLADILNQIFEDRDSNRGESRNLVAPGQQATTINSARQETGGIPVITQPQPQPGATKSAKGRRASATRASGGIDFAEGANIRIIADSVNNALLILASPRDNRMVQAALRKLDIVPLQVLLDATIADVTLTDDLRYGVQTFLNRGNSKVTLAQSASGQIGATFPGFSYSFLTERSGVILDALEGVTTVNVKSSPRLMVLDNQTARLQVGDEVPVTTQQQQSTLGSTSPLGTPNIINSIQFRETGVILEVTPRVNSGGLVTLEIEAEVSNVAQSVESGTLTPTISQRKIKSSIAVQSGETILLGGLIQENSTDSTSGLPILSRIPLIGGLFGQVKNQTRGTELIILLTPHVIRNPAESRAITEEIRQRMRSFAPKRLSAEK